MAEAAGLAFGVLGLAGLFGQAVQCLNMVQLSYARTDDARILHQKLDNQKARFFIWGESIGLNDPSRNNLLDRRPIIYDNVVKTMKLVVDLFTSCDKMKSRYGLRAQQRVSAIDSPVDEPIPLRNVFQRFRSAGRTHRSDLSPQTMGSATVWVISDRAKYLRLVQDLRELMDDLDTLTSTAESDARRRNIITQEVQILSEHDLQLVEEAGTDGGDAISDAASLRLEALDRKTLPALADGVSLNESFCTAPEHHSSEAVAPDQLGDTVPPEHRSETVPRVLNTGDTHIRDIIQAFPHRPVEERLSPEHLVDYSSRARTQVSHKQQSQSEQSVATAAIPWPWNNVSFNEIQTKDRLSTQQYRGVSVDKPGAGQPNALRCIIRQLFSHANDAHRTCLFGPLENDMYTHLGVIPGPPDTPYEEGTFFLRLQFSTAYPFKPPRCCFLTRIYHPNIDSQGAICLDLLGETYNPALNVDALLVCIMSLLSDPNPYEPLVPEIAQTYIDDRETYDANATIYTQRYASLPWPTPAMLAQPWPDYKWEWDRRW